MAAPRGHVVRYMVWSDKRKADTGSGYLTWEECGGVGAKQAQAKDRRTVEPAAERARAKGVYTDAAVRDVFVKGNQWS